MGTFWRTFYRDGKISPALAREGVHYTAPSSHFTLSTITSKVAAYALAERANTLPLFFLNPFVNSVEVTVNLKTTEYTELQPLLSGVHSVMRVKLALAGKGGGCTPTPFHYIYPHQ
jgi:hypothetical protein